MAAGNNKILVMVRGFLLLCLLSMRAQKRRAYVKILAAVLITRCLLVLVVFLQKPKCFILSRCFVVTRLRKLTALKLICARTSPQTTRLGLFFRVSQLIRKAEYQEVYSMFSHPPLPPPRTTIWLRSTYQYHFLRFYRAL
jgi:hypothetical protein